MNKYEVTDEIFTQAIHAAIKETGLIDIISNLDVELKAAKEENARLRERLNTIRAFAAKSQNEGGPNFDLEIIEGFAIAALEGASHE